MANCASKLGVAKLWGNDNNNNALHFQKLYMWGGLLPYVQAGVCLQGSLVVRLVPVILSQPKISCQSTKEIIVHFMSYKIRITECYVLRSNNFLRFRRESQKRKTISYHFARSLSQNQISDLQVYVKIAFWGLTTRLSRMKKLFLQLFLLAITVATTYLTYRSSALGYNDFNFFWQNGASQAVFLSHLVWFWL